MEGQLLIAHPLLNDGYFNRSVIYMTSHNVDGSFGFILNFATQFKLRDLRPHVEKGDFPIYDGGPVAKDQLFFLHALGDKISNSVRIRDNIFFGGDFNELLHLIEQGEVGPHEVGFFAGYCGWDQGQLNRELSAGSWLLSTSSDSGILIREATELWKNKLEELRKSYGIFACIGFDPSLN
jgi:putative transcriptional regulator